MAAGIEVIAPDGKRIKIARDRFNEANTFSLQKYGKPLQKAAVVDAEARFDESLAKAEAPDTSDKGAVNAAGRGFAQGVLANFDDEAAGLGAGLGSLAGGGTFREGYTKGRDDRRAENAAAAQQHPIATPIGAVTGTLATLPLAATKAAKAPIAANALRGGLMALGASEGKTVGEDALAAGGGALGGAVTGAVGKYLGATKVGKTVPALTSGVIGGVESALTGGDATSAVLSALLGAGLHGAAHGISKAAKPSVRAPAAPAQLPIESPAVGFMPSSSAAETPMAVARTIKDSVIDNVKTKANALRLAPEIRALQDEMDATLRQGREIVNKAELQKASSNAAIKQRDLAASGSKKKMGEVDAALAKSGKSALTAAQKKSGPAFSSARWLDELTGPSGLDVEQAAPKPTKDPVRFSAPIEDAPPARGLNPIEALARQRAAANNEMGAIAEALQSREQSTAPQMSRKPPSPDVRQRALEAIARGQRNMQEMSGQELRPFLQTGVDSKGAPILSSTPERAAYENLHQQANKIGQRASSFVTDQAVEQLLGRNPTLKPSIDALPPDAKLVLQAINNGAGSIAEIAKGGTGLNQREVQSALSRLQRFGFISNGEKFGLGQPGMERLAPLSDPEVEDLLLSILKQRGKIK